MEITSIHNLVLLIVQLSLPVVAYFGLESRLNFVTAPDMTSVRISGLILLSYICLELFFRGTRHLLGVYQKECDQQALAIHPVWQEENPELTGFRIVECEGELYRVIEEVKSRDSFAEACRSLGRDRLSKIGRAFRKWVSGFSVLVLWNSGVETIRMDLYRAVKFSRGSFLLIINHFLHVQVFCNLPFKENIPLHAILGMFVLMSYHSTMVYLMFNHGRQPGTSESWPVQMLNILFFSGLFFSSYRLVCFFSSSHKGSVVQANLAHLLETCFALLLSGIIAWVYLAMSGRSKLGRWLTVIPALIFLIYPVDLVMRNVFYIDMFNIPLYEYPVAGVWMAPFIRSYVVISESLITRFSLCMLYAALIWQLVRMLLGKVSGLKVLLKKFWSLICTLAALPIKMASFLGKISLVFCEFVYFSLCAVKEQFLNDLITYYHNLGIFFKTTLKYLLILPKLILKVLQLVLKITLECIFLLVRSAKDAFRFILLLPKLMAQGIYAFFKTFFQQFHLLLKGMKNGLVYMCFCVKEALVCIVKGFHRMVLFFPVMVGTAYKKIACFIHRIPEYSVQACKAFIRVVKTWGEGIISFFNATGRFFIAFFNAVKKGILAFWKYLVNDFLSFLRSILNIFSSIRKLFHFLGDLLVGIVRLTATVLKAVWKGMVTIAGLPERVFRKIWKEGLVGFFKSIYFKVVELLFKVFYTLTHRD